MRTWTAGRVAAAAGADLRASAQPAAGGAPPGPVRAVVDNREVRGGELFVGLRGERVDGGRFAGAALAAGAWGVLVAPEHAAGLSGGAVLASDDPLAALQRLARAWRRALGVPVIGVTGSVGKTSTKQLIAALAAPSRRVAANPANFNTEIGLPLAVLGAPADAELLVLEMGMRGFGQIDELARIAEPGVGVVTNVGPVHLEQVGSLEGVARAKGELLAHVELGIVPAGEPLLEPWLPARVVRFGEGGDVVLRDFSPPVATVAAGDDLFTLEVPFSSRHQTLNLLAAVAAVRAVGVVPGGRVDVDFGAWRGERLALAGGGAVIDDCYNANPLSMRAALADLAAQQPAGRRVAVLGDMLELGAGAADAHRAVGAQAARAGVDLLVTVGPLARLMAECFDGEVVAVDDAREAADAARQLVHPGDVVLVKGSRGVGLEVVGRALAGDAGRARSAAALEAPADG